MTSLFQKIQGVGSRDPNEDLIENLARILNTFYSPENEQVAGSILQYGIDRSWTEDDLDTRWQEKAAKAIRVGLERWEPRLKDIRVEPPVEREPKRNRDRAAVFGLSAVFDSHGTRFSFWAWLEYSGHRDPFDKECPAGHRFRIIPREGATA